MVHSAHLHTVDHRRIGTVSHVVSSLTRERAEFNYVTCGSSLKLAHVRTGARLHSHEVKYGSNGGSSGQNSVTGMNNQIDSNSMWKVLAASE